MIGGTSASAPSWQGIWARAQGAHGGIAGLRRARALRHCRVGVQRHHVGDNVLFPDTPGWDYVTGRGTPDISAVVAGA